MAQVKSNSNGSNMFGFVLSNAGYRHTSIRSTTHSRALPGMHELFISCCFHEYHGILSLSEMNGMETKHYCSGIAG